MRPRWLIGLSMALLLLLLVAPIAQAAPAPAPGEQSCGYWYTVQPGDSWSNLSARTGISIAALQAANPAHIHPHNWLFVGHTLWIPCGAPPPPPPPPSCGYWYTVRTGDSWSRLSSVTGISVSALQAANPAHIHPNNWLYVGHTLWIPCSSGGGGGGGSTTCEYYYTVQPGDYWYAISSSTGVPVNMLYAANPGKVRPPSYVLYVGEVLCIPDP